MFDCLGVWGHHCIYNTSDREDTQNDMHFFFLSSHIHLTKLWLKCTSITTIETKNLLRIVVRYFFFRLSLLWFEIYVSHYRLSAHIGIDITIAFSIPWTLNIKKYKLFVIFNCIWLCVFLLLLCNALSKSTIKSKHPILLCYSRLLYFDSKSDATKCEGETKHWKSDWNINHFHGTSINSNRRYSQFSRGFSYENSTNNNKFVYIFSYFTKYL